MGFRKWCNFVWACQASNDCKRKKKKKKKVAFQALTWLRHHYAVGERAPTLLYFFDSRLYYHLSSSTCSVMGTNIIQIQIRHKISFMCVNRKVLGCFSGCLSKQISIVPPPRLGFQAVILPPAPWDTMWAYDPNRQPQSGAVSSKWEKWLVHLAAYKWVFWAVLSQGRGKSRKPHHFSLGAGGLAGKHLGTGVTMAVDDRGQKVSSPTRMQCLAWASMVPRLMEAMRGQVTPASLPPSSWFSLPPRRSLAGRADGRARLCPPHAAPSSAHSLRNMQGLSRGFHVSPVTG